MTIVRTMTLPQFDDYTVETTEGTDGSHIYVQTFEKDGAEVAQILIYYKVEEGVPLKYPYKFVVRDYNGEIEETQTTE
jgi:hypothetical protein